MAIERARIPKSIDRIHNCFLQIIRNFSIMNRYFKLFSKTSSFLKSYCFHSRIFVNRSLHLENIKFYGFDMDYTLAGTCSLRNIIYTIFNNIYLLGLNHNSLHRSILKNIESLNKIVIQRISKLNFLNN